MRVLLVNHYYPPDTAATAIVFRDLVRGFVEAGHEVSVLCGRPSYGPTERATRAPLHETVDGARILRVPSFKVDRCRMDGRVANYLSFAALAALRALAGPPPEVVIAGSDPPFSVWVGLMAARGRPVVYSLRDLHPEVAVEAGMIPRGRLTAVWGALHAAALRRCSLVICLSEGMAERVRAKGVARERVEVVPDGAWSPAESFPDERVVAELRAEAAFAVLHAGNLGGAGAWGTLTEAAAVLDSGARFVFVGEGVEAGRLRARGACVLPFRPARELPSVMAAGDLQVVSLRPGMDGLVMPSKLYTILAHGRPVLAVVPKDGEVAGLVGRLGCGLVADCDDPSEVVAQVRWAQQHPEALARMAERAREAAATFERGRLVQRFVALVEAVAQSPKDRAFGSDERASRLASPSG